MPVAVIGGGASGTILAAQLARMGIQSALIDGSGRTARGVAYSTTEPAHLLNVRAEAMSAWAAEPDDFAKRFEVEGGDARGFAERRFFGRYLSEILNEAVASGCTSLVHAAAIRAGRADGSWRIELNDGSVISATALALATGNQEPDALRAFESTERRFIANPWGDDARAAINELVTAGKDAFILGTGLTMVDVVLSLDAAGFSGRIVALSRRGLAPRAHADFQSVQVVEADLPRGLREMFRWLRERSEKVGWRAAVDSLRTHTHRLWQGLEDHEQRRFLRHARPWWDVHRHRIAPEVAGKIERLIGEGRLQIAAGRIIHAVESEHSLDIEFRRRGSDKLERMTFGCGFNCTGPLQSLERTRDPLLRSLFEKRLARADKLGMGLDVDENSRAGERMWALGPLTKGRYWEIVAVPDIREQAALVARDIARELENDTVR